MKKNRPTETRFSRWNRTVAATGALLLLLFAACDTGVTEPEDIIFPESDVSYSHHVQPLFDISCSFSGCHNNIDRAGNLSLYSYFDLISRPGVVSPGDSSASTLVLIVGGRLPHSYPINQLIFPEQAKGIAVWVEEGASNN